jgi:hypothetical protein
MDELLEEETEEEVIMDMCKTRENVRYIVIPAAELAKVDVGVRCTEAGCSEVFASSSNLGMHLAKKHRTSAALTKKQGTTLFHCPENGCKYAITKSSFPRATLLKQVWIFEIFLVMCFLYCIYVVINFIHPYVFISYYNIYCI